MTEDQNHQLAGISLIEKTLTAQTKAIKEATQLLYVEVNDPTQWQGTSEEVEAHRLTLLAILSRIHNDLNTLSHPLMSMRANVSERFAPGPEQKKSYDDGYETGLSWRETWNHRPGGPFTYRKESKHLNRLADDEIVKWNRMEKHRIEEWFRGFDIGILKRVELGLYVPPKAMPPTKGIR